MVRITSYKSLRRLFILSLAAWWLLGCTPAEAPPTATVPAPTDIYSNFGPPAALLELNGVQQTSAIGTDCWYGMCSDMIGVPTPPEPLITTSPIQGSFTLTVMRPPRSVQLRIVPATAENEIDYSAGGVRWWEINPYLSEATELDPQLGQDLGLELEPGLYVFIFSCFWEPLSGEPEMDVVYGFLVEVE